MKISTLLLTTSLVTISSLANAGDKFYLSLTGEYIAAAKAVGDVSAAGASTSTTIDFKNGFGGLAAAGYYINPNLRTELEEGYREIKGDNNNVKEKALTTMGNIFYDIPTGTNFTPYLGAGIGWAHETNNGQSNAVAYQGMVGVNYKVSDNSSVFGGYRYIGTSDFTDNSTISGVDVTEKYNARIHAIDVGYRFNF